MSKEQMERALALISAATKLRKQFDDYVLLKKDRNTQGETVRARQHTPQSREETRSHPPLPEAARQYVFRLWRKEIAERFNAAVRELNQLGASHGFSLIEFSAATGEPIP